jgi:ElaB/YqjD/DUF883 family membrane-anchored ribosome-binding protein
MCVASVIFFPKESLMSDSNRHVKPAADAGATVAERVSQSVSSLPHAVADKTRAAGQRIAETAGHVVDAVKEKGEQFGQAGRDALTHGRDRAVRWEHNVEGAVRSSPIVSLLIAAGIGVLAGAVGVTLLRRRG